MVCKVARLMPRPASCSGIMGDMAKIAWGTGRQAKGKTFADMIPTYYMVQAVTCTRHKASAQRSTICMSWLQPVTSSPVTTYSAFSQRGTCIRKPAPGCVMSAIMASLGSCSAIASMSRTW